MNASFPRFAPLALLLALALSGCAEYSQGGYYQQAPPPAGYYEQGPPPGYYNNNPYQGYTRSQRSYDEEYANRRAYDQRRKEVQANCNIGWQHCSNVCNTIANPQQRYICTTNCNNALNNCLRNF